MINKRDLIEEVRKAPNDKVSFSEAAAEVCITGIAIVTAVINLLAALCGSLDVRRKHDDKYLSYSCYS